jgi:hypothetical protein
MAYILGFFFADGFIASRTQTVSFAQKEKYILERIRLELESNHVIIKNEKTGVYILTYTENNERRLNKSFRCDI